MDLFLLDASMQIAKTDYVSFTFFVGTMAMMAAAVFFFLELNNTSKVVKSGELRYLYQG